MLDPSSSVPTILKAREVFPDILLTYYMVSRIIAPKKQNFGKLSRTKVDTVYKIANKVETNWASVVISHMIENKRKDM